MQVLSNSRCANCNTRLDGPFCHQCGQREEPRVPTVRSVLGEVINALFGLESKLWRSLWVLITKPGQLTQEFLGGKRQKYTTPFRLYLLLSIIVFAYMAYTGSGININVNGPVSNPVENTESATPEQTSDSAQAKQGNNIDMNVDDMNISFGFLSDERNEVIETQLKQSLKKIEADVNAGELESVISHIIEPLPKALLIFLPIVALFFKILFLGRGKYYLEHLVYLLHNHALLFLAILVSFLLEKLKDSFPVFDRFAMWTAIFLWLVYVPIYLYKSLRKVYAVSRLATFLYGFVVFLVYIVLMMIMLVFSLIFAGYTYS